MPLNKSKGNMYTFVTHTYNTVKGACPHMCQYCYMKRWGQQAQLHFDNKELRTDLGSGNFIFVGSSCDLFAADVPLAWIAATLAHCAFHKDNQYLFQSKNPERMVTLLEQMYSDALTTANVILCTTLETNRWYPDIMHNAPSPLERAHALAASQFSKFVTIEPVLDFDMNIFLDVLRMVKPVQVNVGADSGHNDLPEPTRDKVLALVEELRKFTTVDQKRNLNRLVAKE